MAGYVSARRKMQTRRGIMRRICLLNVILAGGMIAWAQPSAAEGVLAVGIGPGGPTRGGWVYGWAYAGDNPQTRALNTCRGILKENNKITANAGEAQKACKIVATLRDQCMAISSNGNTNKAPTGFGWVIAMDSNTAQEQALSMCEAMAGTGQAPCTIRASECDGSAK